MFAETVKVFLEFLRIAPRYVIALGVMTAILLFAREEFLKFIGVFKFAQDNRSILGLTLVVTGSLCAIFIADYGITVVKSWWRKRSLFLHIAHRLNCLTEDEKQILRFYIVKQTRSNVLRYHDGVVQGLVFDGIIYQSASLGNLLEGFAYNISEFAWEYLNLHTHLLVGTTNTYRTDKLESRW